jgi:hypothetical protein
MDRELYREMDKGSGWEMDKGIDKVWIGGWKEGWIGRGVVLSCYDSPFLTVLSSSQYPGCPICHSCSVPTVLF